MPVKESQKSKVLILLLLNFVCVLGKDAAFCFKQTTHYNTTLKGGLDAGEYTPWEPHGVDFMTVDLCTKHCCKSPDTDAVFLLNRRYKLKAFLSFLQPRRLIHIPRLSEGSQRQKLVPNPPPSDSTKNKQRKGQNDTAMSRQHPPRRRVMADSDEELGKTTVSSGDSVTVRKLFRLFSRKHSPQTALLARYAVCFFLGGLVGLVPYLVFAIEVCKGLFPLLFHL
ncbi:hypothetical protein P5673_019417 [Acropora cervicornis]|uniref:Transmembrane protein n=1 Tax=Acropora cervicornis TaxID=6130 RepID=A0AAD9QCE4_ACRCE|nr:hypothetical protein P5673_019417 [Acropora cervicornis]